MNKLLKFVSVVFLFGILVVDTEATTVVTTQNIPKYNYYNSNSDVYDRDLDSIERYLFRKTYRSNSLQARLNRIERRVFNRCYPNWNPTRRINHILANYSENTGSRYIADYPTYRPVQRVRNRVIGQPTGFTPSIMDMPFGSGFGGNGINRSYRTNTGYGFLNTIPAMTGAGVRILD